MSDDRAFQYDFYLLRRKVFRFFGGEFDIYDPVGNPVLHSEQKSFKLKEDMRLYSDKSRNYEILSIKARQVLDIGATYDVTDSRSLQPVGALRRKGLKSIFARDEWLILDPQGQEIGIIKEDSLFLGLVRRLSRRLSFLFPQKYKVSMGGQPVAFFKQHFNPFILKYDFDLSPDPENRFDRRLAIAAGILLCAIERRQR
jgi:hypothetical protein